ncbi:MAG TPA: extracellular solute-binding protein [Stellaceae bacterium]|nr:extracellular solute-binding protein [Stellaceae bacterium]
MKRQDFSRFPSVKSGLSRRQFTLLASAVSGTAALGLPLAARAAGGLPERFADLYKAAAKEGSVIFYTDGRQETAQRISAFWKQVFPDVQLLITPLGSPALIAQVETEYAAGQHRVDVTHMSQAYVAKLWKQKGFYEPYKATTFNDFAPDYADADGAYYSPELYLLPAAFNTNAFPDRSALPKSLADFLDPKWKGKIVMPDPTTSGNTLTFLQTLLAKNYIDWDYLTKLATQNVLFVRGNPDVIRMLASGERTLSPLLSTFNLEPAKHKGQPIDSFVLKEGSIVVLSSMGIMAKAPHPNAAKLLVEALLSPEGQNVLTEYGAFWPANSTVKLKPGAPTIASFHPIQQPPATLDDQKKTDAFLAKFKQVFHRH